MIQETHDKNSSFWEASAHLDKATYLHGLLRAEREVK